MNNFENNKHEQKGLSASKAIYFVQQYLLFIPIKPKAAQESVDMWVG